MEYDKIRTTMDSDSDTQYLMVKLNYNFGRLIILTRSKLDFD